MKEIPKKYKHKDLESEWKDKWKENQVYSWDPNGSRENTFVIDRAGQILKSTQYLGDFLGRVSIQMLRR